VPPPAAATLSIAACIFPPGGTDTVKPGVESVLFVQARDDSIQIAVISEIIVVFIVVLQGLMLNLLNVVTLTPKYSAIPNVRRTEYFYLWDHLLQAARHRNIVHRAPGRSVIG
jgi:hypothetical protein